MQGVGDSEVTESWGEVENKELQHGERRGEETHDKDDCPPVPAQHQHQHCLHTLHQQLPPEILYSLPHAKRRAAASSQPGQSTFLSSSD